MGLILGGFDWTLVVGTIFREVIVLRFGKRLRNRSDEEFDGEFLGLFLQDGISLNGFQFRSSDDALDDQSLNDLVP